MGAFLVYSNIVRIAPHSTAPIVTSRCISSLYSEKPEMPQLKIAPSILGADLGDLTSQCEKLLAAGADILHLDVMDGHFVPNLTFGHPVVKCLRKALGEDAFLDCHLMIEQPEKWVEDYRMCGASSFTFHLEAVDGVNDAVMLVQTIGVAGMLAGVAIKPGTPVEPLLEVMRQCAKLTTPGTCWPICSKG